MMDGVETVVGSSLAQEENTHTSTYVSSQAHVGDETPQMPACQQTSGEGDDHDVMSESEEDETQPQWPIFSILNLVVDHIMVPPSPLEPEEFQTIIDGINGTYGEKAVEVPVLRIFGPLLRRRELLTSSVDGRRDPNHYNMAKVTSKGESPQQSGCLHIHGAFPYLLARPIIAGPDGSTSQEQIFSKPSHGWMDWDDESRVREILDEIQLALERTLEDFQQVSRKEQDEGSGKTRWIRGITISVGRGFYTYCPGPPAPFLRIEYYDPSLRWKVKRVLERGLSLGSHCHPQPDIDSDDTCKTFEDDDETMVPLQFRCYEAHIPYTMQFFKDWNLAGMSYIHVSDGRIRGRLPTSARQTFQKPSNESNVDDDIGGDNNTQEDSSNMFLASNSPSHLLWSDSPGFNPETIDKDSSAFSGDQYWTRKETSCDVEFDTSVNQILNVHNVMTSLPDTAEERDQTHWRAVPSLHEIWEQERARMSTLLPPQHDFLSHPSNDEMPKGDSDNITKDEDTPDFETTTPPFTLNVKKGASVSGAQLAVEGVRKLFDTSPGLEEDYKKAMVDIVKRHEKQIDEADERLLQLHQKLSTNHREVFLDDSTSMPEEDATDEVIEGLNNFGDDCIDKDDDHGRVDSRPAHKKKESVSRRLSLTQSQIQEEIEAMELGLQIDRGEGIARDTLTGGYIQDIDPDTLTPFDDDGSDDDFLQEEDRLGEAGLERTLTMLATQHATLYDKAESEVVILEKEIDTEKGFCHDFESCDEEDTVDSTFIKENSERSALSQPADISVPNMAQAPGINSFSEHDADTNPLSEDVSCSTTTRWTDSQVSLEQSSKPTSRMILQHLLHQRTTLTVELFRKAPIRSECIDCDTGQSSVSLYPLERRDSSTPPPWLYFVRKSNDSLKIDTRSLFEEKASQQTITIEPTKSPPSRKKVESWCRKYARRFSTHTLSKRNRSGGLQKQTAIELEISENSRKLVGNSASIGKRKRVCFHEESMASSKVLEVEEAELDGDDDFGGPNTTPTQSQNSTLLSLTSSHIDYNQSSSLDMTQPKCASDESIVSGNHQRSNKDDRSSVSLIAPKVGNPINCCSQGGNESTMSTPLVAQSCTPGYTFGHSDESATSHKDPLLGIGQQGGRIHVQGGGGLKATTSNSGQQNTREVQPQLAGGINTRSHAKALPSPMTLMSIEVHVQCRTGKASATSSKEMAMRADSSRDAVFAVVYVLGLDPGGGEAVKIVQRGCLYVPVARENRSSSSGEQSEIETADRYSGKSSESTKTKSNVIGNTLGISSNVLVEEMQSEKQLLMRLASIVRMKDPDALLSWDTQGGGLGYLIERGAALSKNIDESGDMSIGSSSMGIDLIRLMGRTPKALEKKSFVMPTVAVLPDPARNEAFLGDVQGGKESGTINEDKTWIGSGLGTEWDERVGAGSAAASITGRLIFCVWKIIAEEVSHPNVSYQPAMVSTVLNRRMPQHDDLILTRWYGGNKGRERWRVLKHRLEQATANLLLFDTLDVTGRAGEAARLSGVEFSQSFPGIRGSQYKVEGVLLRALQSVWSDERGSKKGIRVVSKSAKSSKPIQDLEKASKLNEETKSQTQSPWKVMRSAHHDSNRVKLKGGNNTDARTKNRGYFFFSPSKDDCGKQEALECQALTLEPQSGVFFDPVVVCDFTALYPSLVIAYNLCYSTCVGKLDYHSTRREMGLEGRTSRHIGPFRYSERRTSTALKHHLKSIVPQKDESQESNDLHEKFLKDRVYAIPSGSMFVAETVLKGVLPQVLDEMLSTRAMLKKAAKQYRRHIPDLAPSVLRQLEARQLALKYVANVTYGYTSATFSGRSAMPLLADAIVECGRRTLSNAIELATNWGKQEDGKWHGAHVVYGDTDSIFVKLPGRSTKEAFAFGEEFCAAVTNSNPPPIQLKLEKVYAATLLQTKKKYCGMKFESKTEKNPSFDAKGIETVRRDQCALTQKVLRNALITLFRNGVTAVREYLCRQWAMIHAGKLPVSDFILTGRVRNRYRGGRIGPVQAALARRLAEADPGRIVRHKERLPYVIVAIPGLRFRLRDCVLTPLELMEEWDSYTLHSAYYIEKHVNAALQRCLGLAPYNIDVNAWYRACPKPRRRVHHWPVTRSGSSASMISSYFGSDICAICGIKSKAKGTARAVVCSKCRQDSQRVVYLAQSQLNSAQHRANALALICSSCNGCVETSASFASVQVVSPGSHCSRSAPALSNHNGGTSKRYTGIRTPIANCTCIDCPIFFDRHKTREKELEAIAVCQALDIL